MRDMLMVTLIYLDATNTNGGRTYFVVVIRARLCQFGLFCLFVCACNAMCLSCVMLLLEMHIPFALKQSVLSSR